MYSNKNPFVRGFQNLRVNRMLFITYEDDSLPAWRPLHPSQAHLTDDQIARFPCILCKDFALITEGQEIPQALEDQCQTDGIVRIVVYEIVGDVRGKSVHISDTYSEEAARELAQSLCFETGFYSRCWEISAAHITEDAALYLGELADTSTPGALLFIAFRIPNCEAVGVKLIATPWSDTNLQYIEGRTTEDLRQEHLAKGVPKCLTDVLYIAALADVRMLIFDPDAPVLDALTLYDYK